MAVPLLQHFLAQQGIVTANKFAPKTDFFNRIKLILRRSQRSSGQAGILRFHLEAASVDTGSRMKNGKLKSESFFDVEQNPLITFRSTKFVQAGPNTFEVYGDFAIRGVSNPEKLTLTVFGMGTGSSEIKGTMVFNRKDYGINGGIPFIKIANHVDVTFHLRGKRVSGPPLVLKQ